MLHQALCNISKPLVKSNWSYHLEMPNWGKNQVFFPVWSWNLTDDLRNNRAPILCYPKFCASFQSHQWIKTEVAVRKRSIWVKIGDFFVPYDLEIWCMLLCCLKLSASFHSHWWIQTGVTVWKYSIWVKIGNFCSLVTLKFDGWPWKTMIMVWSCHFFLFVFRIRICQTWCQIVERVAFYENVQLPSDLPATWDHAN